MPAKALMIQGTASHVGKSVLVTALCRILSQEGVKVAPFKAQNMALNSSPTRDGGEIGRAQAVQAEAAGVEPTVEMNPILLKPNAEGGCQVVVRGKVFRNMSIDEYYAFKDQALRVVGESYQCLAERFEVIVIEGAGSPAEVNLMERDIVNMRVAELTSAPVILVGDIDRGGVFAAFIGTLALLPPKDQGRVRGFIINKFRGDLGLLRPGLTFLEERTGRPVFGVIPYAKDLLIPAEDSLTLEERGRFGEPQASIRIGVIRLPSISNFTDFDPLLLEPKVSLRYIRRPEELVGLDALILPGSKSTIPDLLFLRKEGLEEAILAHHRRGGMIVGICGGYQMLGMRVEDPYGIESGVREVEGLGLLDVRTTLSREKATVQVQAFPLEAGWGEGPLEGYEIHLGETILGPRARHLFKVIRQDGREIAILDGAISSDGLVFGTYLHGLFENPGFCRVFFNRLRERKGLPPLHGPLPPSGPLFRFRQYDRLADLVRQHVDIEGIFELVGLKRPLTKQEGYG